MLYLSSEPSTCNGLIRVLLQATDMDIDITELPSLKQYLMSADTAEGCAPHHLGLLLVYHLQSLQGVDQLLATAKPGTGFEIAMKYHCDKDIFQHCFDA